MGNSSFALIIMCGLTWWLFLPKTRRLRGREVLSDSKAKRIGKRVSRKGGGRVVWGGKLIPRPNETLHFLVVGTTGSGKTTIIQNLMRSVLRPEEMGEDQRALVYDAKGDMVPFLKGVGCSVENLNPFDADGPAWAMGRDVKDAVTAYEIASIFIPEEGGSNRFFSDAARDVLCEVMKTFILTAGESWTLRDVVCATKSRDWLWSVLSATPDGRDIYESYFSDERPGASVRMTLRSRIAPLEPIAALWSKAKTSVSIDEWSTSNFTLVLGDSERGKTVLHALNRIIFKRSVEVVLDQSESSRRRTWFIVDEGKEARKLDGFPALLNKVRSKGGCVVLGIQGTEGWRSIWGGDVGNDMLGMFSHKALLRVESPETAAWASKCFGEVDSIEIMTSTNTDGSWKRRTRSRNEQRLKTEAVLASEFQSIRTTNLSNGLTGYYTAAGIGAYRNTTRLQDLVPYAGATWKSDASEQPFPRRSSGEQLLQRWGSEDFTRLGITERKCPVAAESLAAEKSRKRRRAPARQLAGGHG